ncbi:hypothetical protein GCM10007979_31880 [Nocardioides albus]|nr:hypothetical protein GCM10007979_31880 [Nocardioides albus]
MLGVSEGLGSPVSDSLGDSVGWLGDSLGSLGDWLGSLGDWLGSLGDSPGSLGDSMGPPGLPVGLGSDGIWVGRAGTGDIESGADSSTARGLAGADPAASGVPGAELPGALVYGSVCDGVEDDFSSGETGEIKLTPDSSVA